jgi:hypothetical protein
MAWLRRVRHVVQTWPVVGSPSAGFYDFDHRSVGSAGIKELLQSCRGFTPVGEFIRALLDDPASTVEAASPAFLVWHKNGPGIGREIKGAVSALLGRFFVRAYLSQQHGINWFRPISGHQSWVTPKLLVVRRGTSDLADWVCARREPGATGDVYICEAKGRHRASRTGNTTNPPAVLETAIQQIENTEVFYLKKASSNRRSIKGWAILAKWATAAGKSDPWLHVVDPWTKGDPHQHLTDEELATTIDSIATEHVASILEGLSLSDLAHRIDEARKRTRPVAPISETDFLPLQRQARLAEPRKSAEKETFVGRVFGPGGPLDGPLDQTLKAVRELPEPLKGAFMFVGMRVETVIQAIQQRRIEGWNVGQALLDDLVVLDPDGFAVGPAHGFLPANS